MVTCLSVNRWLLVFGGILARLISKIMRIYKHAHKIVRVIIDWQFDCTSDSRASILDPKSFTCIFFSLSRTRRSAIRLSRDFISYCVCVCVCVCVYSWLYFHVYGSWLQCQPNENSTRPPTHYKKPQHDVHSKCAKPQIVQEPKKNLNYKCFCICNICTTINA